MAIDIERALLRGRYAAAAARIENNGVPIDIISLRKLRTRWPNIKEELVKEVDASYGIYDGTVFKLDRMESWIKAEGIPWPQLESGRLDLKDETFKELAKTYPQVSPLRDLRYALGQLRLEELAIGDDGRNRVMLSIFQSKTGRNQPSNTKFIFGPAVWLRGLIKPPEDCGVAYIDWSQQEFGIAAALSGDSNMMAAYASGDPYLSFAKQAGAVPPNSTKESARREREQFKACVLAVQYGMGAGALAARIGQSKAEARFLLELHKSTYKVFWKWSDDVEAYAMLHGGVWTVFGWFLHTDTLTKPRTLRNFPMQANGAEMLRLACCFAVERGIKVCAPIHDALLIEAPSKELHQAIKETEDAMRQASQIVLGGFPLRTESKIVSYPDRYMDPRGQFMWDTVWQVLGENPDDWMRQLV